jgi:CDP-diacylglycerol--glycerol-3-phosphate 3-phosphatidyltransferase
MQTGKNDNYADLANTSLRNGSQASAYYRFLARHVLGRIEKTGLTPNQITLIGVLLAVAVPPGFALHPFVGLSFLTLSAVADSLDGLVARKGDRTTVFGAFLDDSLDRVADVFYLMGFWMLFRNSRLWLPATVLVLLAVGLGLVVGYVGIRAALDDIRSPATILDRTGRTLFLIAWAGLIVFIPGARPAILWSGLILYDILVLATLIQRIVHVQHTCHPPDRKNIR